MLALYDAQPLRVAALFFAVYVAVTALSLPGAAILTLAAGALFGLVVGHACSSRSPRASARRSPSSRRATCCATAVQAALRQRLADIDEGIERDGAFYLFTLRLVPVFPFFVINLLMGLTRDAGAAPSTGSASSACWPARSST